jgi:hypothetical protein
MSRSETMLLFLTALGCGLCVAAVVWIVLRVLFGLPEAAPLDAFVGMLILAPAERVRRSRSWRLAPSGYATTS